MTTNYEQHEADISEQMVSSSGRDFLPDSDYTHEDISESIPPDLELSSAENTHQSPDECRPKSEKVAIQI